MVKEQEVKVFMERLFCNKCETEMEPTGVVLCSFPPQYEHYCPNCNNRLNVSKSYPSVKYVEV